MSASSRESTASSHRAHLQRISRASSYAHEPSSQEPKLGRNDRLAAPGRTPPWMVAWLPPPPRAPLVIHAGTAPWHSRRSWLQRSVLPCPGGQGGMAATLAASRCSQRMPWGRRLRRQLMTSSPGRSGLGGNRGRSPAAPRQAAANLLQLTLGGRAQRSPPVRPPTRYSLSCWATRRGSPP